MYEEINADQIDEEIPETVDTTETTEPAEETAQTEQATETAEEVKPFIRVKHSNADKDLTEQEAVDAIQQGLFVKDNGGASAVKWMLQKAKDAGYSTIAEYQTAIDASLIASEVEKLETDELIPHERAVELVEGKRAKEILAAQTKARQDDEINERKAVQELAEFRQEFPDVNVTELVNNLPAEIKAAKQAHPEKSLADLYARHLLKQAKSKEQVSAQAAKNKDSSTGSLKSDKDDSGKAYYDNIAAIINSN